MKTNTRVSYERAYGYFMDHCHRHCALDASAAAGSHVTNPRVAAFLSELVPRVGTVTRWSYVSKIRRVTEIISSENLDWLKDVQAELRHQARPRPKHHRIVDGRRLLGVGLNLIARGETGSGLTRHQRSLLVRDGLMITILSLAPIRLSNLHSLRFGRQLSKIDGIWWLLLEGSETKSGRPDERPIAASLGGVIDRWPDEWRKTFRNSEDFVWASTKGGCLAYTYVGDIISKRTRQELGVAINPHLFRDCAVYTIANLAGENMGIASGLLQHLDPRVTGDNYNKGELFTAARRYQRLLLNQGLQPTRTGNE